jgi:aryl-alcohol dehydrogenase-like predicted oxidoreductase
MDDFQTRAAAALATLPEHMQEKAVEFLLEQGEKWRVLKALVQEGLDDVAAGNVEDWDIEAFLAEAEAEYEALHPPKKVGHG